MKLIAYGIIFLLIVFLRYTSAAQTTNVLYQFISEFDGKALSVSHGQLSFETQKSGVNKYDQLFILKKVEETGKVLICSASENTLFLKRSGDNVILEEFTTGSDTDFLWNLNYTGYPYLYLSQPGFTNSAVNRNGNSLQYSTVGSLDSNNDPSGEHFRLSIIKTSNTL